MQNFLHSLAVGIIFGAGGVLAGLLIGVLLSYSDWLYKLGVDGPAGLVAILLLIFTLSLIAGSYGFISTLVKLRRQQNKSN